MFSALIRENERNRAQRVGATDYLQKPITKEMLAAYLDEIHPDLNRS
jgi:CheY-like chemotaxis protein